MIALLKTIPFLLFFFLSLLSPAQSSTTKVGKWTKTSNEEWWQTHQLPDQWIEEKKSIHDQLLAIYSRIGSKKALTNKNFHLWVNHLYWLSLFPENWQQDDYFSTAEAQKTFRDIALDTTVQKVLLENLSPHDNQLNALKIFCQIYQANRSEIKQYANLAAAFSIVFDQPFPQGWPHAFVNKESLPLGAATAAERFAFYTKANKEKKLLLDIRKISAQNLKFVVDTPIKLTELATLQHVKIKSARQLEKLFQSIRYDKPRLASGDYIWANGEYLVRTINKQGGLCVDQAYFTVHTGKALGVPSIMFMGQGNSGAHAWVGAMKSYGTWGFDYAKFRNEDYPVGQSYDPQTWRRLTDSECIYLDRRNDSTDLRTREYLLWANLNKNSPIYLETVRAARRLNPQFILTWEMESSVIAETELKEQERFWRNWISTFAKQNDLKFRGEKRLLALYQQENQQREYDKLLANVVKSNRSKREDIVVKVAAEKTFVLIEQNQWDEAHKTFKKAMQYLRSKAGGALFYNLVQPYVRSCLDAGKHDFAKDAMTRAKRIFEAKHGSILDHDLKQLNKLLTN